MEKDDGLDVLVMFNHQVVSHRSLVPSTVELCPRSQSENSDLIIIISCVMIIFIFILIIILIDR